MAIVKHNYETLQLWKSMLFSNDLLTEQHIIKEIGIKKALQDIQGIVSDQELNAFYLVMQHSSHKYLLHSSSRKLLPLIPTTTVKTAFGQDAYRLIKGYRQVNIMPEKKISFREIVDGFCDFKHSEPNDFLLYKIIVLCAWIEKIYCRVCTSANFGKDSVVINSDLLFNFVNIVSNPTMAKAEYSIIGAKLLAVNEVSNLTKEEKKNLQNFFLNTAANQPKYTKKSRARSKAGEVVDISQLSELILYNNLDYYIQRGQDYFESIFTRAVCDRFLPIKFKGKIDPKQFRDRSDKKKVAAESMESNIAIMKSLMWYGAPNEKQAYNYIHEVHDYKQSVHFKGRHGIIFDTIFKFIDLYSNTQEECTVLETLLHQRIKEYMEQLNTDKTLHVSVEVVR